MGPLRRIGAACLLGLLFFRPAAGAFVDALLAEVSGATTSASDIALARALGLFGLNPTSAVIDDSTVDQLIDAQLVVSEATRLGIQGSPEETEEIWRVIQARLGGAAALDGWLERSGIERSWAERMVRAHLRWRKFIDLRFHAFAFVTEEEVSEALGPGSHDSAARERVRKALKAEQVSRRLSLWLREARERAVIRRPPHDAKGFPNPFAMPASPAATTPQEETEDKAKRP